MPCPGVSASSCSCRISPNSRGPSAADGGNDACLFRDADGLAVLGLGATGGFGRLMRLAKDWELVEIWSSGMNLERWVALAGLPLGEPVPVVRSDEYD